MNTIANFAQPVSMPCTEDQYNEHLKEGLEKLGYEQAYELCRWEEYSMIATKYDNVSNYYGLVGEQAAKTRGRHFIDHFNPELFLAIAGMREGEEVHVGEWMMCLDSYTEDNGFEYKKGVPVLVTHINESANYGSFGYLPSEKLWRKATIGELINHFKKETMGADNTFGETNFNEHSFKFGDKVIVWDFDGTRKDTCRFITYKGGDNPYVATDLDYFDNLMSDKLTSVCSYKHCIPYSEPLKITHADIAEKFGTTHFIIE